MEAKKNEFTIKITPNIMVALVIKSTDDLWDNSFDCPLLAPMPANASSSEDCNITITISKMETITCKNVKKTIKNDILEFFSLLIA
jgi:hypothetical protein